MGAEEKPEVIRKRINCALCVDLIEKHIVVGSAGGDGGMRKVAREEECYE